jgi:hypothetical protein
LGVLQPLATLCHKILCEHPGMLVDLAPADKNINQMENINVAKHKKRVLRNAGLTLMLQTTQYSQSQLIKINYIPIDFIKIIIFNYDIFTVINN